nr:hypothetical protein 25 [Balneolaceae bacterium]
MRGVGQLFRKDKPTKYERRLARITDVLEADATAPLTENRFFKEGSAVIDKRSERNRDATQNTDASTGRTHEASLAATQDNNEADQDAMLRLLTGAERFKQKARSRFLNALGLLESAKQARNQRFNQDMNSIIQPLQGASQAFLLSDIFDSPEGTDQLVKDTPEADPEGTPMSASYFDSFNVG